MTTTRDAPDAPDAPDGPLRSFTAAPGPSGAADDPGRLAVIVRRPRVDAREILDDAILDPDLGLIGDSWLARGSRHTLDGSAELDAQVTLMSVGVLAAIEPDPDRWPLSGDQLLVDLELAIEVLPAGSRLSIGEAVLEISGKPHTGCAKFSSRFGSDALRWINSPEGRAARRRGLNARVVQGGRIRVGDEVVVV